MPQPVPLAIRKTSGKDANSTAWKKAEKEQRDLQTEIIRKEYRFYNPGLQLHAASAGRREGIFKWRYRWV